MTKILVVDDTESVRYSFQRLLSEPLYAVVTAGSGVEGLKKASEQRFDLIILDVRLPDMSGLSVLREIKRLDPKAVVLIITAFGATETAIEATKLGAYDYILKPFDIPVMRKLIDEALECSRMMRTDVVMPTAAAGEPKVDRIIGACPAMQEVYKMIGRIAGSDVNVLIRGESGTGKELIARAVYLHSNRSHKQFLTVNCAAIPETLLESELFGHEKGSFTGANRRRIGKFEQADQGTLFLDEIGDMSLTTQAKILRVIQEGCFERVGGEETLHVDVRLLAATNKNLEQAIAEGKFREDLYYRIKVVTITLPPLRARRQDIPELADYFLEKYRDANKDRLSMSPEALEALLHYDWPGNVRELENLTRRAVVLCKGNVIPAELFTEEFKPTAQDRPETAVELTPETMQNAAGALYKTVMERTERALIKAVLQQTGGNQVQAAELLGISRVTLRDRIFKYELGK